MSNSMKAALIVAALAIPAIFFWKDIKGVVSPATASVKNMDEGKKDKDKNAEKEPSDVSIISKWETPEELLEISGLVWLNNDRFACVQDEKGIIYIYNTSTKKIEEQIPFAGSGDYEGLAIVGNTAYVMRADGRIFEVDDITKSKPAVKEYSTHLTVDADVEGFTFDKNNNRLLAAIKGTDPNSNTYKGIYAFDIKSNKMQEQPVYKINLEHEIFKGQKSKKKEKIFEPSELAVHPLTREIYITDGDGELLVLDKNGNIKSLLHMTDKDFTQAEGITFSDDGRMFISNEGKKQPGNILEVALKNNN